MIAKELRGLSTRELARRFLLSYKKASTLKAALNPRYVNVLSNRTLSSEEMSRRTGLKRSTISSYRSALLDAGLIGHKANAEFIQQNTSE